jgi:hypothetical protein
MGCSGTLTSKVDVPEVVCEWAEIGEAVIEIKYLASAPEKVIVVGEPTDEKEGKLMAAAVFLFGIGGTWWNFFRKKPAGTPEMPTA